MRPLTKTLLVIEVGVCFAPAFITLFLGILFIVPAQIYSLRAGDLFALVWISLCAGGIVGTIGLVVIVNKVFAPEYKAPKPRITWFMIACGVVPLVYFCIVSLEVYGISLDEFWSAYLPLICTMHFIYLGRHYLLRTRGV